ncbi:putative endo-1,3(4)-beta-glucanase [Pseudomassariella vexata]|uniref:Putative endo-1,3(4)-beta-glucanase n=1 Tax=Pseudomassariella vexata TaxID=1141098 RepID=A0A1Y2DYW6_9PEZI|nr:putative endo-1,3(4)-beta-glucanase [Pseudomassariella vexata]ORY64296.1 putative endo-1,3(4)-beta-glucanase [Pseudomassariella vexata]
MRPSFTLSFLPFTPLVAAWAPPSYSGYILEWYSGFEGASGSAPDISNWNIITGHLGVNNELETYTSSAANLQRSGGSTLQIVPWRDSSVAGGWSSGRIESKYTVTPAAGTVTRAEALIRFGGNSVSNKAGLWPAFWMLGNSIRNGTPWPACGELDVMETVNGALTGYGTIHCDVFPGGICNEGTGIGASTRIADQGWHTWTLEWNRRPGNWQSETIIWYIDGIAFQSITGDRINNQAVWDSLAHSPMYFILNMAVGGSWPGNPNSATLDGYGSMMEVAYVAHYGLAKSCRRAYVKAPILQVANGLARTISPRVRLGVSGASKVAIPA